MGIRQARVLQSCIAVLFIWVCRRRMADGLLQAVRGLWLADPERPSRCSPSCGCSSQTWEPAGNKEVREALLKLELKAESEAKVFAAAAPPAADDEGDAPPNVALSLACFGCARLPSEMGDDREKHPVCPKCRKYKVPTTYWCCVNCPGNPGAWKRHAVYHKQVKGFRKMTEDGGASQQMNREAAEELARHAQSGDEYVELIADGLRYQSQQDWRRAARAYREAIALRPDDAVAYFNLGAALSSSGHYVEAAQRFLEAKERYPVGSGGWAEATGAAFNTLTQEECAEVAKPEWWNDGELKALSAMVVRAAPNDARANQMRARVLSGPCGAWEAGPRSAAELMKAATHFERAAALHPALAVRYALAGNAAWCRRKAGAM